jgi:peptidoglycan/LPS O-acetylase OafA/YrhL
VFFVISGFIIPFSLASRRDGYSAMQFPRFFARRVVRLEPPYIVSVLLAILLWNLSALAPGFNGHQPSNDVWQFLAHVGYLVPLTKYGWIQPVYWTLAYEFIFYIAVGLLFPWVLGANRDGAWYASALALAMLVYFKMLPVFPLLFVVGIAVYRAAGRDGSRVKVEFAVVFTASVLLIARTNPDVAVAGAIAGLVILAWRDRVLPARLSNFLLGLGAISYSLYLTHVVIGGRVVNLGMRFVHTSLGEVLLSALALLASLVFAWIFWRFVETPSIQASRRT